MCLITHADSFSVSGSQVFIVRLFPIRLDGNQPYFQHIQHGIQLQGTCSHIHNGHLAELIAVVDIVIGGGAVGSLSPQTVSVVGVGRVTIGASRALSPFGI